jgi:hypothetical protein
MPYFFTLIIFASLIFLIVGLVNPQKALFWSKKPATRKKSSLIYGLLILLSFIGVGVTAPDIPATAETKDSTNKVDEGVTKTEAVKVKKPATVTTTNNNTVTTATNSTVVPANKIPSQRDILRALARNCDTTFTFMDDSTGYDHDTGWVVAHGYQPWYGRDGLNMGIWEIPTYNTPSLYDIDENKKLRIYQKVRVRAFHKSQTKKSSTCWYTVSPMDSEEQYILADDCFTLKDISQCSLKQKAKNGFVVKALYKAPTDPRKRPHGVGNEGYHPVNIPSGSIVLVLDYRPEQDWMWGYVYTKSGKEKGSALFYESTLTEIK